LLHLCGWVGGWWVAALYSLTMGSIWWMSYELSSKSFSWYILLDGSDHRSLFSVVSSKEKHDLCKLIMTQTNKHTHTHTHKICLLINKYIFSWQVPVLPRFWISLSPRRVLRHPLCLLYFLKSYFRYDAWKHMTLVGMVSRWIPPPTFTERTKQRLPVTSTGCGTVFVAVAG
jgi:hypothetical protein